MKIHKSEFKKIAGDACNIITSYLHVHLKCGLLAIFLIVSIQLFSQGRKAVFIIVDGIPADLIEKLPTPSLDSIAAHGGYKRAVVGGERDGYSETPTISAVGYNSVLTGTWVNKHNVWGNYGKDIAKPNYNYKTIFRLVKDVEPNKKIGIFSSWLDNRTKLAGENLSATSNLVFDYKYDSLEYDTITYPNDTTSIRMRNIDQAVVKKAASAINENAPDLSWIYLEFTDDMGHTFGDSKQFYDAIQNMDQQIGIIWSAVQNRMKRFKEDWLIIITTDHGRDSVGLNHGGQSDRERSGWIVTNSSGLNSHFSEDTISIVDIMPTIASFMGVKIPADLCREVDGTSLRGKVEATMMRATNDNGVIKVTWKSKTKSGKVKIWTTTTNDFRSGNKDRYKLMGEYPVEQEHAEFKAPPSPKGFYKVVLETPHNTLNRWIVE